MDLTSAADPPVTPSSRGCAVRLDDLWSLQLLRPTAAQLTRRFQQIVRELEYRELVARDQMAAVAFLRTDLSSTFDHSIEEEARRFQHLASLLFSGVDCLRSHAFAGTTHAQPHEEEGDARHGMRTKVYEKLLDFFPADMTQPKDDLMDLIHV